MTSRSMPHVFSQDPDPAVRLGDVAMPIVIGAAVGLGTGAVIWMMIVVHFGLMRLF